MSVNQSIQDREIRHAVTLSRLQAGEARRIDTLLRDALPEIERRIEERVRRMRPGRRQGTQRTKQLRALRDEVRSMITGLQLQRQLKQRSTAAAVREAEFQQRLLQTSVPKEVGVTFKRPSVTLLRAIVDERPMQGRTLVDWTQGLSRSAADRVSRTVNLGLVQGDDVATITRGVRDQLNVTRHQATAVTRTAITHVTSQARDLTFRENSDLIKGVQWVATLDTRTSSICMNLDGQVFDLEDDEGPRPPAHFNCRSTTSPVLKSFRELGIPARDLEPGTRASMDGQVPQATRFGDWLQRQTAATQDEALGPVRAQMWRDGTIKLSDLAVCSECKPLTVEQLKAQQHTAVPLGSGTQVQAQLADFEDYFDEAAPRGAKSAIDDWSQNGYEDIRELQLDPGRCARRPDSDYCRELRVLESVFEDPDRPQFEGEVYRGMELPPDALAAMTTEGNVIELETFSSWSRDPGMAQQFSSRDEPVIFHTRSRDGLAIESVSASPDELEVMLGRGQYRVSSVEEVAALDRRAWSPMPGEALRNHVNFDRVFDYQRRGDGDGLADYLESLKPAIEETGTPSAATTLIQLDRVVTSHRNGDFPLFTDLKMKVVHIERIE